MGAKVCFTPTKFPLLGPTSLCRCSHTPMRRSMTKRVFYWICEVSQAHGLGVFHWGARNKITDQLIKDIYRCIRSPSPSLFSCLKGRSASKGCSWSRGPGSLHMFTHQHKLPTSGWILWPWLMTCMGVLVGRCG